MMGLLYMLGQMLLSSGNYSTALVSGQGPTEDYHHHNLRFIRDSEALNQTTEISPTDDLPFVDVNVNVDLDVDMGKVEDDEERFSAIYLPDVAYPLAEIIWGILLLSAIVCVNGCVLWIIGKSRELWKPRHMWVACLCVADLFVGAHKCLELFLLYWPQRELCIFRRATLGIPYVCNMLILTLLSLDRYVAVRCPFYYASTIKRKHVAFGFFSVILAGSVLVAMSMFFGFRDPICRPQRVQLVSLSIVLSICSIIIFLFNSCVLRIARKQLNTIHATIGKPARIRSRGSSASKRTTRTAPRRISLACRTLCMRGVEVESPPPTPLPPPPAFIHADAPCFLENEMDLDLDLDMDMNMEMGGPMMCPEVEAAFEYEHETQMREQQLEREIEMQVQVQVCKVTVDPQNDGQQPGCSKSKSKCSSTSARERPHVKKEEMDSISRHNWSIASNSRSGIFFGPETFEVAMGRQLQSPLLPIPIAIPLPITLPVPLPIAIPGAAVIPLPPILPATVTEKSSKKAETFGFKSTTKTQTQTPTNSSCTRTEKEKLFDRIKKGLQIPFPKLPFPIPLPGSRERTPRPRLERRNSQGQEQIGGRGRKRGRDRYQDRRGQGQGQSQSGQSRSQSKGPHYPTGETASALNASIGRHSNNVCMLTRTISLPAFPRAVMVVIPPDPTLPATVKILTSVDSAEDLLALAKTGNGKNKEKNRMSSSPAPGRSNSKGLGLSLGLSKKPKPNHNQSQNPGESLGQNPSKDCLPRGPAQSRNNVDINVAANLVDSSYTIKVALPRSRSFTCGKKFGPEPGENPVLHPYPRGLHMTRTHGILHVWKLFPSIRFARTVLLIMIPMWIFLLPIVTIIPMQRKCMQRKEGEFMLECDLVNRLWSYLQVHMRSVLPCQAVLDTLIYAIGSKEFRRAFQKYIFESQQRKERRRENQERERRNTPQHRRGTGPSNTSNIFTVQFKSTEQINVATA